MNYKEIISDEMEKLAQDPKSIFLGYNVGYGSRAYGTLSNISTEKCHETPLAENLMVGLATGLSLTGYHPIVFFERHDFLLNAADGIVNHIDKIERLSKGQFKTPMIIRAIIGSRSPLDPGLQHIQDFTEAFRTMLEFPVYAPKTISEIREAYDIAKKFENPVMIVENKNLYNSEV